MMKGLVQLGMKKDTLLKGTIILASAALIARVLGVAQRIPLKHLLGDTGMATYGIAYNVYFVLLMIATAGIPSALSKLISERMELGHIEEAKRVYRAAIGFAIGAGAFMTVVLYVGAPFYAGINGDPNSTLAVRALAPALLLFPAIAIMRGYFQGLQFMLAGGMSQIVEQFARVITAVFLAYLALELGYGQQWAVAGASFGGVMGSISAFGVMLWFSRRLKLSDRIAVGTASSLPVREVNKEKRIMSLLQTYKLIFVNSIPITLAALSVPLINLIDSSTVIPLLKGDIGFDEAWISLGLLSGRAQSLAGIPIILAIAVSQSVLPIISSAHARRDHEEVGRRASQVIWLSIIIGLGIVLTMITAARPLNGFIFADTKGTDIIMILTAASMLQIVMMTTTSILYGIGKMKVAAAHVYIGIAVKVASLFLLAPVIGMYGVLISTLLCFVVITVLNLVAVRRSMNIVVLGRRWIGLITAVIISLCVGFGTDWIVKSYLTGFTRILDFMLQAIIVGSLCGITYMALLFVFSVIRQQEVVLLPGPLRTISKKFVRGKG
ncbi:MAG: polysaccharide biosynthesis protein [Paenibacillaceae bacterium]